VRPAFTLSSHPVLTNEDEDREHNAFRRDEQRQDSEGEWIEGLHTRNQAQVYRTPSQYEENLQEQERRAANEFGNRVTDSFGVVRRSSASCSSLATASMLNLVGC
jgi:hypothetical protein